MLPVVVASPNNMLDYRLYMKNIPIIAGILKKVPLFEPKMFKFMTSNDLQGVPDFRL